MSTAKKPPPTDLPTHAFATAKALEAFFARARPTDPGIYIKFARKSTGIPSVTPAEAVEEALCVGWIDGRGNSLDDTWYTGRYTPRRAKSIWSQKNVDTVARLTAQGRMRPAGLAAVQAAQADGRWARAYAGPATISVPDDLARALAARPAAQALFDRLNKSERYSTLWRVETASPAARAKRIEALVQMLADGDVPGAAERAKFKPASKGRVKKASAGASVSASSGSRKPVTKQAAPIQKPAGRANAPAKGPTQPPRRAGLRPRS